MCNILMRVVLWDNTQFMSILANFKMHCFLQVVYYTLFESMTFVRVNCFLTPVISKLY